MAVIHAFYQDRFLCRAVCQELSGQTISLKEVLPCRTVYYTAPVSATASRIEREVMALSASLAYVVEAAAQASHNRSFAATPDLVFPRSKTLFACCLFSVLYSSVLSGWAIGHEIHKSRREPSMHFSEEAQLHEHCSQRLKSWGIFAPPLLLVPATTGSGASKIFDSLPTGPAFTAIGLIWALLFGLTVTLLNRKPETQTKRSPSSPPSLC